MKKLRYYKDQDFVGCMSHIYLYTCIKHGFIFEGSEYLRLLLILASSFCHLLSSALENTDLNKLRCITEWCVKWVHIKYLPLVWNPSLIPFTLLNIRKNIPGKKTKTNHHNPNQNDLIYVSHLEAGKIYCCLKFLYRIFLTDFFIAGQQSNLAMLQI